jgi:hypothetical protein
VFFDVPVFFSGVPVIRYMARCFFLRTSRKDMGIYLVVNEIFLVKALADSLWIKGQLISDVCEHDLL